MVKSCSGWHKKDEKRYFLTPQQVCYQPAKDTWRQEMAWGQHVQIVLATDCNMYTIGWARHTLQLKPHSFGDVLPRPAC